MGRRRGFMLWVPLPPPFAGPEVASQLLVSAVVPLLDGALVENATVRTDNMAKGGLDARGLLAFARSYPRFVRGAVQSRVVYLVAAANIVGSIRDAMLIASARLLGKRVVLHLRGGNYRNFYAHAPRWVRAVVGPAWRSVDLAIVQTDGLRSLLQEAAPDVPVEVLPNGLRAEDLPAKISYSAASTRLLFVGHLSYSKGFYDLVRAFQDLRRDKPQLELWCAGARPSPSAQHGEFLEPASRAHFRANRYVICEEINRFLDAGEAVGCRYLGTISGAEKRAAFREADLFVLPSYVEGFSVAILEAMFHGLPVVATGVGGTPDIIVDEVNGYLVPAGDVGALKAALTRLLSDHAMCERIGRRNATTARERYSLERVVERFAAILNAV
jgi:glycosyltransferase involved in cell wall biosynthesis